MEAFFRTIILTIIIETCSARTTSGGSTSGSSIIPIIVVPVVAAFAVLVIILVICRIKCMKRSRMGVLPFATQMALAQQQNQYAPPNFYQAQPYGQVPLASNQAPLYGQAPLASNQAPPPSLSPYNIALNAQKESTKN